MPTLEYFFVARGVAIDRFTDSLSVFSIVEQVTPRRLPALILRMMVVAGWNCTSEEIGQEVTLRIGISQSGVDIPAERQQVNESRHTIEGRRNRSINQVIGLPLLSTDDVIFELFLNGQSVAHHTILVNAPDLEIEPDGWLMYVDAVQDGIPQAEQ
jgi:hypothetical protein